jgi:cardiolipin synthase
VRFYHSLFIASLLLFTSSLFAEQLIIEPDMGRQPIQNMIRSSHHSLNLVMYGLTDNPLLNDLMQQKQSGKTLKILLEHSPYKAKNENNKAIQSFHLNQVDWQGYIPSMRFIHQKTLIVDGSKMIVMTFNFTKSTFAHERNFALIIDDPQQVKEVEAVFSADWHHIPTSMPHSPDLIYSPDNSRLQLVGLISGAKHSIQIYAQSISDYRIVGMLAKAAHHGIKVQIITSSKLHTKPLDYLAKSGVIIQKSRHYYIHAKVMIIDKQKAIIGSINLTRASLDDNRELAVITRDPSTLNQLITTFNKDWANAIANDLSSMRVPRE